MGQAASGCCSARPSKGGRAVLPSHCLRPAPRRSLLRNRVRIRRSTPWFDHQHIPTKLPDRSLKSCLCFGRCVLYTRDECSIYAAFLCACRARAHSSTCLFTSDLCRLLLSRFVPHRHPCYTNVYPVHMPTPIKSWSAHVHKHFDTWLSIPIHLHARLHALPSVHMSTYMSTCIDVQDDRVLDDMCTVMHAYTCTDMCIDVRIDMSKVPNRWERSARPSPAPMLVIAWYHYHNLHVVRRFD